MNKRILKKIAKDWAKGILFSTEGGSFEASMGLTHEEESYIIEEVHKIGRRIIGGNIEVDLEEIIKKYYTFE